MLVFIFHFGANAQNLNFNEFLEAGQKDCVLAVQTVLKEASKLDHPRIVIAPGEYHFYPEKAYEKYSHVSNHDNSLRRVAFPILDFDHLEIAGENARFIFHGLIMPFLIEDSKNISISGITIDWEIPLHSEAEIVANDPANGTFDIRISEQYPYVIRNGSLHFIKEGYEHDLGSAILFDPERKAVTYRNNDYMPLEVFSKAEVRYSETLKFPNAIDLRSPQFMYQDKAYRHMAEEIEPGLVRISTRKKVPPVGMILVCKGSTGRNRMNSAFHIIKSNDVELSDLSIQHAGGMGVIAERSSDITLERVKVQTNPKSNRMVSTTADATHFVNCKGKVTLKDCVFQHMLDDATNVHGAYVIVDKVFSDNRVGVHVGQHHQAGFLFAEAGDKIGFVNQQQSTTPEATGRVSSVDHINGRYYIITFEGAVPDHVDGDYILENLDWYPECEISGCTISNNRARGILLSTPRKTVVEQNYFSNMMTAILVPVELSYWYESGQAQDLIIRNNKFGDCCYAGNKQPVINIHSSLDKSGYTFGKIIIADNEFEHFDSWIIHANGVEDLAFTNNKISTSRTWEPIYPEQPVLEFEHIGVLKLKGTIYDGDSKPRISLSQIEKQEN